MNSVEEKIYFRSDVVLSALYTKKEKIEESGISIKGEMKVDDSISIITDKEIKIEGDLEDTHRTYVKVMEMRDLTDEELKYANKSRRFLAKMFEIMFYNKKAMVAWTLVVATVLGINIADGNFLGIALDSICILVVNRPIKFIKEVLKMVKSEERKEELIQFLSEQKVLGYIESVDNKNDIKMYAKIRGME